MLDTCKEFSLEMVAEGTKYMQNAEHDVNTEIDNKLFEIKCYSCKFIIFIQDLNVTFYEWC
jgi:hypothetical protein